MSTDPCVTGTNSGQSQTPLVKLRQIIPVPWKTFQLLQKVMDMERRMGTLLPHENDQDSRTHLGDIKLPIWKWKSPRIACGQQAKRVKVRGTWEVFYWAAGYLKNGMYLLVK